MNGDKHQRLHELFRATVSLPAAERRELLDRECAGSPDVRAAVERLLAEDAAHRSPNQASGSDCLPDSIAARLAELPAVPEDQRPAAVEALCQERPEWRTAIVTQLRLAERWLSQYGALDTASAAMSRDGQGTPRAKPSMSILDGLAREAGVRPRVRLREIDSEDEYPSGPGDGAPDEEAPEAEQTPSKYELGKLLGRGGVGVVYRAEDRDLGRSVALKFLRERYRDHPQVLRRFVKEAQIGAQLQHPGILPVYDLGVAEGRPFFAMKLVKGETFKLRLTSRPSPSTDLQRHLRVFEQICQAVGYAHARGVVHRDLKPENVMIGAFGEVQVVDWGLGKVLPRQGEIAANEAGGRVQTQDVASVIETVRSRDKSSASLPDTVIGTPAYMPPEQAVADLELVDQRSDVFALGSILCEVLTGAPAYVGRDAQEVLAHATYARLDDARRRLDACGAEDRLLHLARSCLNPERDARPENASRIGDEVAGYLSTVERRAQEARVVAAQAEAAATSARQRQRLSAILAGTVVIGLITITYFWFRASTALGESQRFHHMGFLAVLSRAREEASELQPAWPDRIPKMEAWLETRGRALQAALPDVRESLRVLQEERSLRWGRTKRTRSGYTTCTGTSGSGAATCTPPASASSGAAASTARPAARGPRTAAAPRPRSVAATWDCVPPGLATSPFASSRLAPCRLPGETGERRRKRIGDSGDGAGRQHSPYKPLPQGCEPRGDEPSWPGQPALVERPDRS